MLKHAIALAALVVALSATAADAATVTAPATEDTSVEQRSANTNFGSGNDLVGGVRRGLLRVEGNPQRWALLKYQVPAFTGTVTQVRLRLFKRSGSPSEPFRVQSSPCSWNQSTVTWNSRPTLGAVLATLPGYPTGSGFVEFALPTSAVAPGQACFAITKPSSSGVFITADDVNAANPSSLVITTAVDTTPPETTITAGPTGSTSTTSATFSFSSSEPRRDVPVLARRRGVCAVHEPHDATRASRRPTTSSRCSATDAAGNVDASPATQAWTITPPPPPSGYCAAPAVTGAWTGDREDDPRHTDHAVLRDRRRGRR